jgi:hypothetical protein
MHQRAAIHKHLEACALEVLSFVKESEHEHEDRWVPTAKIKEALALNFVAVPKDSKQYGEKGWLFAILARMLEDNGKLEYKKNGSRSYCRSVSA